MTNSKPKDIVRRWKRSLKNIYKEYNEVERRVRDATSNDPWPSTSTQMYRIACDAGDQFRYDSVLGMLLKRVQDYEQMMHVKKGLLLAEYLLRNAPQRFVNDMKDRKHIFDHLTKYRFLVDGVDKAEDVCLKAAAILRLLDNDKVLKQQRETAERTRGKFIGYANDSVLPVGDRYNNSTDPFASSPRYPNVNNRDREEADSSSEAPSENSSSSSESEVAQQSMRRKASTKKTKKEKKRDSKARKHSSPKVEQGDLVDMDIVTGEVTGGSHAPSDNWLSAIAQLEERPAIEYHPTKALFDDLPPASSEADPFAPVQSTSVEDSNIPAVAMDTAGPVQQQQGDGAVVVAAAPADPLWGSDIADVSNLCHPHDYEGQRMQMAKHKRTLSRGAGGKPTLQQLAQNSSAPRPSSSMPALGDGRLSHVNPFESSMVPDGLKTAPQQPMLMLPAPQQSQSQAMVPATYYGNANVSYGQVWPQQQQPLALPMPGPNPYPMPLQQQSYAPAW